jgi:ribokinase
MFLVSGNTTVDLFVSGIDAMPRFEHDEFSVSSLAWCAHPLTMTLGGNGANSAYVLAALGTPSALISAAGRDLLGDQIARWLDERGVDQRGFLRSDHYSTPTTTTIMDERHNRIAFYHPGPLHDLRFSDLPPELFTAARGLLITGYALLPGFRPDGYAAALAAVRSSGGMTAVDIGPAIGTPVLADELTPLLPLIDFVLTNEYELSVCSGASDPSGAAQCLLDAGAQRIVLKRGALGAALYQHGEPPVVVPGFPVEAQVTVGAGDTFNAAFLHATVQGMGLERALTFANAAAALVLAGGRSVLGAPGAAEVEAFLRERDIF